MRWFIYDVTLVKEILIASGSTIIILSPDVAEFFPDSDSVNEALRTLAKIARKRADKMRTRVTA
jgi:hypothetical protein